MQSTLLSLVLLLSLTYVSDGIHFNCSVQNFQQCMASLQAVTQSKKLAFASTKEELTDVCQQLQDGIQCVDEHTKRCFSSSQQHVFNSVVSGSRQVIEDLCVPGSVQEQYLRYAQCFKNVSTDERKCASKYRRIVLLSEAEEKDEDVEEALKKTCCAFTEFVHCKYTHVVRDCGQEAGVFLQRQQERMSGSLIHQHCALYTYGTDTCSNGSLPTISHLWILSVGLVMLSPQIF